MTTGAARPLVWLLVVGAVSSSSHAQTIQEQAPRPPPLPPEPGRELWRGTVRGNDPSVQVEARLCPEGDRIVGMLQWSSTVSGWNRRSVEGAWEAGRTRLVMRDTAVVEQRPQPGWVFCTVDRYELSPTAPGVLDGTYDSAACRDHAITHLQLVSTDESPLPRTVDRPTPPAPPPTVPPPPPLRPTVSRASPCSAAGPVDIGGAWALLPFAAAALRLAARRL